MLCSLVALADTGSRFSWHGACTRPLRARAIPCMQVGMTGGDLEGGRDGARNAEVEKLKQLFYKDDVYEGGKGGTTAAAGATATEAAATRDLADLGLLRDVPIARFRFVLMPHQQAAFNIFQPQLVHMFETLLATPPPWLYVHALLPGTLGLGLGLGLG